MLFTKYTIKKLNLHVAVLGGLLTATSFGAMNLQAAECGVLKFQKDRSQATAIINNTCPNANELAMAALLEIKAGGRLWLESLHSSESAENFEIICQNKSSATLNIKINSATLPWIQPEGLDQCHQWINNRLECTESATKKKALFCAVAPIRKMPENQNPTPTTSLATRSIHGAQQSSDSDSEQTETIKQWLVYLQPEIDLCRKVFNVNQPITLTWQINTSGVVSGTRFKNTNIDHELAECVTQAIENFRFPDIDKAAQLTFSF